MKSYGRSCAAVCLGALLAVVGRPAGSGAQDEMAPIEDLRLPLEYFENGKIKSQLRAGSAIVPPNGPIEAKDVRAEFYDQSGELESVVTAESCRYSREDGTVWSDTGKVRLERPDIVISGLGFQWKLEEQRIRLLQDVRVELTKNIRIDKTSRGKNDGT
jgi:hypothetical protein